MRHLAWAGVAVGVAFATAASCVPDFEFRPEGAGAGGSAAGTGGGGGGQGGAVTSASSAGGDDAGTEDAGGGGGGPVVPVVPCKNGTDCAPGVFCCFHESSAACDTCSEAGQCQDPVGVCGGVSNYRLLRCNGPEDCQGGQVCCEDITGDTACYPACGAGQRTICRDPGDCPAALPSCVDFNPPYPGYKYCAP